jgi:AcrR family transcriptional regulator
LSSLVSTLGTATARDRILDGTRALIDKGEKATVGQIAEAAGISRASFYRAFDSRDAVLQALELAPEPATRERILEAALNMVGSSGLASLSMDELAERAQVSRATLYRLFPGKAALFTALVHAYSPLDPVVELLSRMHDQPPAVVLPEVARTVYRNVCGQGVDHTGLIRAFFFEVSALAPDTEEAARETVARVVSAVMQYMIWHMSEGRLRTAHPLLALQSFIGPIFFHLLTRAAAERVIGVSVDGEQAVTELAETWLRAMQP